MKETILIESNGEAKGTHVTLEDGTPVEFLESLSFNVSAGGNAHAELGFCNVNAKLKATISFKETIGKMMDALSFEDRKEIANLYVTPKS